MIFQYKEVTVCMAEKHSNLRGGEGIVTTRTRILKIFGKKFRFIRLKLYPKASIGWHYHHFEKELYFTFSPHIRFNESKIWKLFNFCKNGNKHCAVNTSAKYAKIYAIKF